MSSNESVYEMNRATMGYALIINNLHDDPGHHEGTRKDVESLKKLFKLLQMKVKIFKTQSKVETERIAKKLMSANFADYNLFILVVLSHGIEVRLFR